MEYQIKTPNQHRNVIIPVPFEKVKNDYSKIDILIDNSGNKYKVLTTEIRDLSVDIFPYKLLLACTGQKIEYKDFKMNYPKSDLIVFFICEKIL